jgi:hypothetical protein
MTPTTGIEILVFVAGFGVGVTVMSLLALMVVKRIAPDGRPTRPKNDREKSST